MRMVYFHGDSAGIRKFGEFTPIDTRQRESHELHGAYLVGRHLSRIEVSLLAFLTDHEPHMPFQADEPVQSLVPFRRLCVLDKQRGRELAGPGKKLVVGGGLGRDW